MPSRKDLIVRKNRIPIPHLLPFKLHRVSGRGHTLLNTVARPPGFRARNECTMSLETRLAYMFGLRGYVSSAGEPAPPQTDR